MLQLRLTVDDIENAVLSGYIVRKSTLIHAEHGIWLRAQRQMVEWFRFQLGSKRDELF